jgi:hypothetical protein
LLSFFSFLAAAFSGFAFALLSFLSFFFSPWVNLVDLTMTLEAVCFGGMVVAVLIKLLEKGGNDNDDYREIMTMAVSRSSVSGKRHEWTAAPSPRCCI